MSAAGVKCGSCDGVDNVLAGFVHMHGDYYTLRLNCPSPSTPLCVGCLGRLEKRIAALEARIAEASPVKAEQKKEVKEEAKEEAVKKAKKGARK